MISVLSVGNLLLWVAQVAAIVCAGLAGPKIFRIHHPRSQLVYYYTLLVVCIALPFVQPWHDTLIAEKSDSPIRSVSQTSSPPHAMETWAPAIAWLIAAGIAARMSLFVVGLLRIRHYRRSAIPFEFPKGSVLCASKVTHGGVSIGVSANEIGPVTIPNAAACFTRCVTLALQISFLLGRQLMFGQEPPIQRRSTTAALPARSR